MLCKERNNLGKKAVSPLIATILLVGFAVAIAAVVVLYGTGIVREQLEKGGGFAEGKLACQSSVKIDVENAVCGPGTGTITVSVENLREMALPNLRGRVIGTDGASSSLAGVTLNGNEKKSIAFVYDSSLTGEVKAIEVIPVLLSGSSQATCDDKKIAIDVDASSC